MSPISFPICTACVRRFALSLSNSRLECVLTVFSLTNSFSAISRLLIPCAISARISSSRFVMPRSFSRVSLSANGCAGDLLDDHNLFFLRELQSEPDPHAGE